MEDHLPSSGKRQHLTNDQRVPRCYKEVEKVLQAVKACQGNIKTVMYNSRLRGSVFNKVYALAVNVLKQRNLLEKIIEKIELLEKEKFRKEMAGILIYELVFGKGLPGDSKPVQTILKYEEDILNAYESLKDMNSSVTGLYSLPKYVRVNTMKSTVSTVLKDLESWEYQQVFYKDSVTFDEFLELVKCLETGSFLIDYHFKDLFIFASKENLSSWPLYQKGHIFIHDKSSYLPVHVLDPKPESTVLDACAAPGMKTIHIAALMQNSGKIYAFERDKQRFEILKNMLDSADVEICSSSCEDFYLVNQDDPKYQSVESILVDPSCSGSGMVNRMDEVTDTEDSKNKLRLQKLAGFQILLLKHALSFPSVKRVVYSTCSVTEEENEFVVHEVLNHYRHCFKLVPVIPDWPFRGYDNFEFGTLCLRAFPEKSLTNGFFVAMFERLDFDEQQRLYESSFADSRDSRKGKSKNRSFRKSELGGNSHYNRCSQEQNYSNSGIGNEEILNSEYSFSDHSDLSKKKKLKHMVQEQSLHSETYVTPQQDYATEDVKKEEISLTESDVILETSCYPSDVRKKSKKHKKKHSHKDEELAESHLEECIPEYDLDVKTETKKRKKKRHHDQEDFTGENIEDVEVPRFKLKKSKKVKSEDNENPPVMLDEGKYVKVEKSVSLSNEESYKPDFEPSETEVQEITKKKHKKKCKNKKHKGE